MDSLRRRSRPSAVLAIALLSQACAHADVRPASTPRPPERSSSDPDSIPPRGAEPSEPPENALDRVYGAVLRELTDRNLAHLVEPVRPIGVFVGTRTERGDPARYELRLWAVDEHLIGLLETTRGDASAAGPLHGRITSGGAVRFDAATGRRAPPRTRSRAGGPRRAWRARRRCA